LSCTGRIECIFMCRTGRHGSAQTENHTDPRHAHQLPDRGAIPFLSRDRADTGRTGDRPVSTSAYAEVLGYFDGNRHPAVFGHTICHQPDRMARTGYGSAAGRTVLHECLAAVCLCSLEEQAGMTPLPVPRPHLYVLFFTEE